MLKVRLKTFQSGCGDCIFFMIDGDEGRYAVMIDCGFFSDEIKNFVTNTLCYHIDLLIITHIDEDHILGVRDMLESIPELKVEDIWFNSYRRPEGTEVPLTEAEKVVLERLFAAKPVVIDMIGGKISAPQAVTLSDAILKHKSAKNAWGRKQINCDCDEYKIKGDRYGKFIVLTPRKKELEVIEEKFKSLFFEFFHKEHPEAPLKEDYSIFEMLQRLANMRGNLEGLEGEKVSAEELNDVFLQEAANQKVLKSSDANEASIAFVWEKDDERILFVGDASPKILAEELKKYYGDRLTMFKAIKVSHHGSAHGTSKKLMELVDATDFFFTGGDDDKRPHINAISRIVTRSLTEGIENRILHFNYQNSWTDNLRNNLGLQEKYHFAIDTDNNDISYDI